LEEKIIGTTRLEDADPSIGVVFGKIEFIETEMGYQFIKNYCQQNQIELAFNRQEDKVISVGNIHTIKVVICWLKASLGRRHGLRFAEARAIGISRIYFKLFTVILTASLLLVGI
jgi:hypothetical protein